MKRFFASDAESDMLIAEATKTFGLKIGDIINMAIKNQFLPITDCLLYTSPSPRD